MIWRAARCTWFFVPAAMEGDLSHAMLTIRCMYEAGRPGRRALLCWCTVTGASSASHTGENGGIVVREIFWLQPWSARYGALRNSRRYFPEVTLSRPGWRIVTPLDIRP
jgi:hypothetical protein